MKDKYEVVTYGTAYVELEAGRYTEDDIKKILAVFQRMRSANSFDEASGQGQVGSFGLERKT